jgi:uncharacterized membrane protein YdjX (TVP38/TMEM64 family)
MAKRLLTLLFLAAISLFFYFRLDRYLTLETLQESYQTLVTLREESPWMLGSLFFTLYLLLMAFSLPGLTLLKLTAGAIFGLWIGVLLVSFASTIGATLAFLLARYLLRAPIQERFAERLLIVNQGMAKSGAFYLLTLRLVPVFPSFLVNLLLALTNIRVGTFYWVSQVGMFPALLIYVQAGTRLPRLQQLTDILSFETLCTLSLLALLPLLALLLRKKIAPDMPL